MINECPVNVILGCDDGKFRVAVKFTAKGKRQTREKKFNADKPKMVVDYLVEINKELGIDNIMESSSMHFPTEDGVTKAQVKGLYNALDKLLDAA